VENDLLSFDNLILTSRYDANQQQAKAVFLTSAARQTQRMCMGILAGEDAIQAKLSLAVLTSVKLSFSSSEANWTEVGCSSCTPKQAFIDFQGLKTIYGQEYTCGDSNCIGACVAAVQVIVSSFSKDRINKK